MGVMRKCRNCHKPFEDNFTDFAEQYCSDECFNEHIKLLLDSDDDSEIWDEDTDI